MRIKPWVVTGTGAVCAGAALAVIVATNDPYTASTAVLLLFWTSLLLLFWAAGVTALLLVHMTLTQAVILGLTGTAGGIAALTCLRNGWQSQWLLGGILLATLAGMFLVWHKLRHDRHS